MQLAQAVGIDPKDVNFVSYDGGGDLLPAVLGNKVAFGASGYGEFLDQVEAGEIRVLATSGAERVKVLDAPTLKESGVSTSSSLTGAVSWPRRSCLMPTSRLWSTPWPRCTTVRNGRRY